MSAINENGKRPQSCSPELEGSFRTRHLATYGVTRSTKVRRQTSPTEDAVEQVASQTFSPGPSPTNSNTSSVDVTTADLRLKDKYKEYFKDNRMTVPSLLKNRTTTAKDFADEVIKIAGVSRNEEETLSVECLGDLIASIHSRLNDPVAAADFLKPFLTELHEETTIRLICELAPSKVFKTPFFERLGNFVHDAATSRNVLNMNVILKNLYKDTIRNKAFRKIVTATLKEEISKPARNFLNSVFPQKSAPSKNASSFSSNHNAIASSAQLSLDEIGDDLDKIDKDFESSSSSASSASSSDVGFGAGSGHSNSAALEMDLLVASDPYSTETLVKLAKKGSPDQINQWFKVAPPTLFNLRSTQLALLQAITDTHEANLAILMEKITRLYPKGMNLDSLVQSSSSAPSASSSSSAAAPTMDVESPTLNQPEIEDPEIWDWDP